MPFCFAYGTNMDRAGMAARCPAARVFGPARLARHRLAIMREGYLTVVPDPRRSVHGLLWDVPLAAMRALDRYEEVGRGLYTKRQAMVVTASGAAKRALVYLGADRGPGTPRPGYLELVLRVAASGGLPAAAISEIRRCQDNRVAPQLSDGERITSAERVA